MRIAVVGPGAVLRPSGGAALDRALQETKRVWWQAGKPAREEVLPRSLWRRIALMPGVEVHVASTSRLPSPARLRELAEWCRLHFADAGQTEEDERDHD